MKNVYCLYRVSTKQQVDKEKNDIPMQRIACREFADKQGWTVNKEYEEKGISGFKVSATDRDAIQELKEAALKKEFDILLVFMFDRIGRIEDETPFVVEWFVKQGIEVWSVKEGEQRFDTHVDKLTNYIRFWQASGESEKTSMRIKTRLKQLTEDGVYTGGHVPFGYTRIFTDKLNKKGTPVSKLEIKQDEAEIVRWIFNKVVEEGYGSSKIAEMLNDKGIKTHTGSKFQSNTVLRILKNKIYCGYYVSKDVVSPKIDELVIIDCKVFDMAQKIIKQRDVQKNTSEDNESNICLNNRSKALLTGVAYCGDCGCKLTTMRYMDKYKKRDGTITVTDEIKYYCYYNGRKLNDCNGQATYSAKKIDNIILMFLNDLFKSIIDSSNEDQVLKVYRRQYGNKTLKQEDLLKQVSKYKNQLEHLNLEMDKAINNESPYSAEDINAAICNIKLKIDEALLEINKSQDLEYEHKILSDSLMPAYRELINWALTFDDASFEAKKMIICRLFKRVEITRGYKIKIILNDTYKQFCEKYLDQDAIYLN